jgi:hypothetical protein
MSKVSKIGLTTGALMACSGAAAGNTITQTFTFGPAAVSFNHTISFNPFNSALGTLTGVTSTITETLSGSFNVTYPSSGTGTVIFGVMLGHQATFSTPDLTSTVFDESKSVVVDLTPDESTGLVTLSATGSATNTAQTGALPDFVVSVPIQFQAQIGDGEYILGLPGDTVPASVGGDAAVVDDGTVTEQLVYTYTPVTPTTVPEPGSLAIIGSAVSALGFLRWRKRKT